MTDAHLEDNEALHDWEELDWFTYFMYASLKKLERSENQDFQFKRSAQLIICEPEGIGTNYLEQTREKMRLTWVAMNFRDSTILVAREIAEALSS